MLFGFTVERKTAFAPGEGPSPIPTEKTAFGLIEPRRK
jgi:hypothetical protein